MNNQELKNKITILQRQKQEEEERIRLEKQFRDLNKKNSKMLKILKFLGKISLGFGKIFYAMFKEGYERHTQKIN